MAAEKRIVFLLDGVTQTNYLFNYFTKQFDRIQGNALQTLPSCLEKRYISQQGSFYLVLTLKFTFLTFL